MAHRTRPRRLIVLAALLAVLGGSRARAEESEIRWFKSLAQASEVAQRTNQPILIDFWADWCGPCKVLDAEVYKNRAVLAAFGTKMVGVRIHYDLQPDMVTRFNVPALPYLVFANSYGTELMHHRGLIDAGALSAVITAMPGDVAGLNQPDRILRNNQNDFKALGDMAGALRVSGFYEASNRYFARALKQNAARDDTARESILLAMAGNSLELRDGKAAASDLQRCLKEFPKSAKRSETLLGLGKAYVLDDKRDLARKSLTGVITDDPQSDAARQARDLLKSLEVRR